MGFLVFGQPLCLYLPTNKGRIAITMEPVFLNTSQKQAVECFNTHVSLSSGAGCGKTTVLCEKYVQGLRLGLEPHHIVAITFTEKAAGEMKNRILLQTNLDESSVFISTIHGFCRNILKQHGIYLGFNPLFEVIDEPTALSLQNHLFEDYIKFLPKELIAEYGIFHLRKIFLSLLSDRDKTGRAFSKHPALEIQLQTFQTQESGDPWKESFERKALSMIGHFRKSYDDLSKLYQNLKTERGVFDFEDLLCEARELLYTKKDIREFYQDQIQLLMVDEFQDTNELQRDIIMKIVEGGKTKLFIVGDPKQSIYRFRGAQVEVFHKTKQDILKGGGEEFFLQENYRSGERLIHFTNALFSEIFKNSDSHYVDLFNTQEEKGEIVFGEIHDDTKTLEQLRRIEATYLASKILALKTRGFEYRDMSILFRAMTSAPLYASVLKSFNIPTFVVDDAGFFKNREIQDIFCFLKTIEDQEDLISLAATLRSPFFALTDETLLWMKEEKGTLKDGFLQWKDLKNVSKQQKDRLEKAYHLISQLRCEKDRLTVLEIVKQARDATFFDEITASDDEMHQKFSRLDNFFNFLKDYKNLPLFELIQYIEILRGEDYREAISEEQMKEMDGVKIMSVHKSKGLEFPAVFLPDIGYQTTGNFPLFMRSEKGIGLSIRGEDLKWEETYWKKALKNFESGKEIEESKRLFYVAVTRAKSYLHLSATNERKQSWLSFLKEAQLSLEKLGVYVEHISADSVVPPKLLKKEDRETDAKKLPIIIASDFIRKKPGLNFSVTALQEYQTCGLKFKNHHIEEIPEVLEEKMEASKIGTEVHSVLEKWDFKELNKFYPYLSKTFSKNQEIIDLLYSFQNTPIFEQLRSAKQVFKEYPFFFKFQKGVIEGIIDVVFEDHEGKWFVLDYKTNKVRPEHIETLGQYYQFQTDLYAWVMSELVHPINEVIVLFLRPGVCYQYKWNENLKTKIENKIRNIFDGLEKQEFKATLGKHCRYCGYKNNCEEYIRSTR